MTQSSYLMSFIHGLMENSSKEVRERKRRQLERDYSETEEVLNVYLNEKYEEVTKILNVYREVSHNLENNRNAVQKMKRDIAQCKSLLSCNREELRRLWLELIEQRRSLELIDILDRVRMAPELLKSLIAAKAWPEATEFSLYISNLMSEEVDHVPALESVKTEMNAQKKMLVEEMRASLFYLVFNHPLALVIHNRSLQAEISLIRNGEATTTTLRKDLSLDLENEEHGVGGTFFTKLPLSDWREIPSDPPAVDPSLLKDPKLVVAALLAKSGASKDTRKINQQQQAIANIYLQQSFADKRGSLRDRHLITDKTKWAETIVALTHCLHKLQKLTQPVRGRNESAFSGWRVKAHSGMIPDVQDPLKFGKSSTSYSPDVFNSSQDLAAEVHNSIILPAITEIEHRVVVQGESLPLSSLADPTYLTELLQLIFPALFMHFGALMLAIRTTQTIKKLNPNVNFDFLEMLNEEYVWGYIQHEVQLVLSSHLANTATSTSSSDLSVGGGPTTFNASKLDLNALMGKKKMMHNFNKFSSTGSSGGNGANSAVGAVTEISGSSTDRQMDGINFDHNIFFSFSKTSHNLSVNSYLRENRLNMPFDLPDGNYSRDGVVRCKLINTDGSVGSSAGAIVTTKYLPVVCQPAISNVKAVYSLVLTFAKTIEEQPTTSGQVLARALFIENSKDASPRGATGASPKHAANNSITMGLKGALIAMGAPKFIPKTLVTQSRLRAFLINFIERVYLPHAQLSLRQPIVMALSNDALNTIISQQTQRDLGLNRPILTFAHIANQGLGEVKRMTIALPEYASNCSRIAITLLETITEWASNAYRNLSFAVPGESIVPSAEWARDSDLSRFWKKFPVWQRMAAADAYASATSAHFISESNYSTAQQNQRNTNSMSIDEGGDHATGGNGSLRSASAVVFGLSNISLGGSCIDASFGLIGKSGFQTVPFVKVNSMSSAEQTDAESRKSDDAILYEREATRLAVKEMDKLLHMIRDEIGSSSERCLPTAQLLIVKGMGRLHESLHWLVRCVRALTTWFSNVDSNIDISRFTALCEELTDLSDACVLMVYLDVRVHSYNLFGILPQSTTYWCPVDEVDVDPAVTKCLLYWEQLQEVLIHAFSQHKLRFIFDGLGDFISQLFLRIIPQINRMNPNGNRKMCRNIYKLQQALALFTENHESDLIRVKQLYELFYLTPEIVINRIIEQGAAFEANVYQDLLRLYQRSHPSHDFARTDECISKLAQVIRHGV